MRLLLIEDSARLQRSLGHGLRRAGYALDSATDITGSQIVYHLNADIAAGKTGTLSNTVTVTLPAGINDPSEPTDQDNGAIDTDGAHTLAVAAVDKAGNPAALSRTFTRAPSPAASILKWPG